MGYLDAFDYAQTNLPIMDLLLNMGADPNILPPDRTTGKTLFRLVMFCFGPTSLICVGQVKFIDAGSICH